jgi:Pretoxin HINT domain
MFDRTGNDSDKTQSSTEHRARRWVEQGACFAKGTLVHTKEGLKPIEQIQVGDRVLSKPENGGEQAYKRVLKTFAHEPQRIAQLQYTLPGQNLEDLIRNVQGIKTGHINTTLNHPFWTKEEGWTAPSHMQHNGIGAFHFQDKDGGEVEFWSIKNIYLSDQPNVGWTSNSKPENISVNKGSLWDYAEHRLVAASEFPPDDIAEGERPDPYFKAPVYNLEVEDFHTYYVGEHGLWVHN